MYVLYVREAGILNARLYVREAKDTVRNACLIIHMTTHPQAGMKRPLIKTG